MLRRGVKLYGARFDLLYFKPSTSRNPDLQKKYRANVFSVVRQLPYSPGSEHTLDLVLFLNGLPLFTGRSRVVPFRTLFDGPREAQSRSPSGGVPGRSPSGAGGCTARLCSLPRHWKRWGPRGPRIDQAQESYHTARKRLTDGRGNLLRQVEMPGDLAPRCLTLGLRQGPTYRFQAAHPVPAITRSAPAMLQRSTASPNTRNPSPAAKTIWRYDTAMARPAFSLWSPFVSRICAT